MYCIDIEKFNTDGILESVRVIYTSSLNECQADLKFYRSIAGFEVFVYAAQNWLLINDVLSQSPTKD